MDYLFKSKLEDKDIARAYEESEELGKIIHDYDRDNNNISYEKFQYALNRLKIISLAMKMAAKRLRKEKKVVYVDFRNKKDKLENI